MARSGVAVPVRRREKRLAFAVCEACQGRGADAKGDRCRNCGGSGRITVEVEV